MKPHNNTLKSQPTVGVYNDINLTGRFKLKYLRTPYKLQAKGRPTLYMQMTT